MDIYVLHDGQEIGPLSVEKTRLLLNQGSILGDDLAWTPGMEKWEPLASVLPAEAAAAFPPPLEVPDESAHSVAAEPVPVAVEEAPVAEAPAADRMPLELSTPKQRALLAFLHIPFNLSTSKQEAALLISDAMENPAYTVRLGQWPRERLKLHGDLFVAELQARKENRVHHYLAIAQTEGASFFTGINRTHVQSVVTLLDLEEPEWEANDATAVREHFFPALAAKFPQLVREESRGRFAKAKPKKSQRLNGRGSASGSRVPWGGIAKAALFAVVAGGIGWFAYKLFREPAAPAPPTPAPAVAQPASTPAPTEPPNLAAPAVAPAAAAPPMMQ